jgi:hypothetical protein
MNDELKTKKRKSQFTAAASGFRILRQARSFTGGVSAFKSLAIPCIISETKNKRLRNNY